MNVAGARVLVTGAASGIGRAPALAAAARGATQVRTDRDQEGLLETAERAGAAAVLARALDITDREAVEALAGEAGVVDVVANVAGISSWGAVDRLGPEDWRKMIEVNLMGPINVIGAFVGPMIEARRGGHVVNVSSAAGLFGLPWHAAYSASKFGLRGVSEVLRFDLRRHRIGVTLVCPGGVDTPLVQTVEIAGVRGDDPRLRRLTQRFRRHAVAPERVADMILRAVERNRYLVLTSPDIRALWLTQRYFPPGYNAVMRILNWRLVAELGPVVGDGAGAPGPAEAPSPATPPAPGPPASPATAEGDVFP